MLVLENNHNSILPLIIVYSSLVIVVLTKILRNHSSFIDTITKILQLGILAKSRRKKINLLLFKNRSFSNFHQFALSKRVTVEQPMETWGGFLRGTNA